MRSLCNSAAIFFRGPSRHEVGKQGARTEREAQFLQRGLGGASLECANRGDAAGREQRQVVCVADELKPRAYGRAWTRVCHAPPRPSRHGASGAPKQCCASLTSACSMSHSSGIPCSEALNNTWGDARTKGNVRFLKIVIQNDQLVHTHAQPLTESFDADYKQIAQHLLPKTPCYIVFRLDRCVRLRHLYRCRRLACGGARGTWLE